MLRPSTLLPDGATSPEAGAEAVTASAMRKSSPGITREALGEGCRLNARESPVECPCEEQEGRVSGEGLCAVHTRWTWERHFVSSRELSLEGGFPEPSGS